jgi:hypothetical protein
MSDAELDKKIRRFQNIMIEKYKSAGLKFSFNLNRENYAEFRAAHPNINDDGVDIDKVLEMVYVAERMRYAKTRYVPIRSGTGTREKAT